MSSPFPGMDPYLETPALWNDFHASFLVYWSEALNELLPENYESRVNAKLVVREIAPHEIEEHHERHIEILRRPDRRLIARLELLSPRNKEEPDRWAYLKTRSTILLQPVHLVEVDLLLMGQRLPMAGQLPTADYFVFVSRWDTRPKVCVWPCSMQEPLPRIPIPLVPPDPDVAIDLGALFRTTYERGRYARSINYALPPVVSLDTARLGWVIARARGVGGIEP